MLGMVDLLDVQNEVTARLLPSLLLPSLLLLPLLLPLLLLIARCCCAPL